MKIYLNNEATDWDEGTTVLQILDHHSLSNKNGIAVAVNETVIGKATWPEMELKNNDKLMVITATAGG